MASTTNRADLVSILGWIALAACVGTCIVIAVN